MERAQRPQSRPYADLDPRVGGGIIAALERALWHLGAGLGAFYRSGRSSHVATLIPLLLLCSRYASADGTLSIDFSSYSHFSQYFNATESAASGTAGLWNLAAGRLQAPVAPGGAAANLISFGDGSDGAFSDGPTSTISGISVVGTTITFNTSTRSDYEFTSFVLSAPYTLVVTGTQPLTIRSLGTITIAGTIDLDGADGANNNTGGSTPTGGAGAAGASDGGNGGVPNVGGDVAGTAGSPGAGTAPRGGGVGTNTNTTASSEGGGGGCSGANGGGSDATPGTGAGAPLANQGSCAMGTYASRAAAFETTFTGGAGGGGGGSYRVGANLFSGGGGGSGGSALRLVALGGATVTGTVSARGGDGGDPNTGVAPDCGGGGGGGSGGSIWIQSASTAGGAGTVIHSGGTGGVSSDAGCVGISEGGNGSRGVLRVDTSSGAHTFGTVTPAASADQFTVSSPASQTFTIVSRALDFSDGLYAFDAPTETVGCGSDGTLSVTYEGSPDGVTFTRTASAAAISDLDEMPFIRVRVEITTSATPTSPPCLSGLSIPYRLADRSEIRLDGSLYCGGLKNQGSGGGGTDLALLFAIALIAVAAAKRRDGSSESDRPT